MQYMGRMTTDQTKTKLWLVRKKEGVRMKYKSTPHLVFKPIGGIEWSSSDYPQLPIIDVIRDVPPKKFGGDSQDEEPHPQRVA